MKRSLILSIGLCLGLSVSLAKAANAETVTREFEAQGLKELQLQNISGDVRVVATLDPKARVVADKEKFSSLCTLEIERADSKLIVKVTQNGESFVEDCKVALHIQIPKEMALDLMAKSSLLSVRGIEGRLRSRSASGELKASGEFKSIEVQSASGGIQIDGAVTNGTVKTASGEIKMTLPAVPEKGELKIDSSSGDAVVLVPRGSRLRSTLKTASGDTANEIGNDAKAGFRVSMKSASGDLKIKAY